MALSASAKVYAQAQTPAVFTLEQAIEYALQHSVLAKNAILDEEAAQAKVKETVGIGLPQVNGSVTVAHNQQLQRFFQTKQVAYGFSGFQGDYNDFLPGVGDNDVIAARNFFQLPSSGEAKLSVTQILFNGSYLVGLKAANAYKDLAYKATDQTKEQLIQQVTKAYYAVLINKERIELFNSNIARVDTLLRNTKALHENGFAEGIDVDRIKVTLNNLLSERDKFSDLNQLGVELLKFQINYPMSQPLEVAGSIESIEINADLAHYREDWNYKNRPDYRVLEANRKLQELNIRNQYANAMPSLAAFLNAGMMTQSRNIGGVFKTETNFSAVPNDQLQSGIGTDKWYGYSMFGLSLNVPIFSGLQNVYKIQQQKLSMMKIENNFKLMESSIDLEIRQASVNFENALRSLATQKENMELAGKVARVTKIKYEQGVGSNLEVVDAEDGLRQAQINYYSALFDAAVAKVDLDKAYGSLLTPANENK